MDAYGDERTEELLEELEKRIHQTYKQAHSEMQDKIDAYFSRLKERDGEQKALLDAGKITKQEYEQWRLAQIARGKRYEALRDEYAQRMTAANQQAAAYINDQTPGIYSLNQNYAAYTIERISGNVGFTLIDEQTVRRLIQENPDLFYRPAIDTPLDTVWNRKKLTAELCSGILQGESIGQIADRFQNVSDMNRTSALRNARTAVTNAQNAGRQASYDRAKAMGLPQRKYWMATKDLKTRESHRKMDGVAVELDGWFTTPLGSVMQYPGDRNGKPVDYYNCRCTVSTREKEGIEAETRMMRVRDPVTGENVLVQEMTYQEWYAWKMQSQTVQNAAGRDIIKVNRTTPHGIPDSITQVTSKQGGISRNYYDSEGRWIRQISNNNHGNKKQHPFGRNGEHAHDVIWENEKIVDRPARELTENERKENIDIL